MGLIQSSGPSHTLVRLLYIYVDIFTEESNAAVLPPSTMRSHQSAALMLREVEKSQAKGGDW